MNYEYKNLTLTASSYNKKTTLEIPMDSNANEVFEAFKTLMIGLQYPLQAFDNAVISYYEEYDLARAGGAN